MAQPGIQNYLNTLIFCIVAVAVSVIILGLLVIEPVREKALALMMTIEIGLAIIIVISIYNIRKYDKRMEKERSDLLKSSLLNISCPDFYMQSTNCNGDILCTNGYKTADGRYQYTFKSPGGQTDEDTNFSSINLDATYIKKNLSEVCTGYVNGSAGSNLKAYTPWTDLASKCEVVS